MTTETMNSITLLVLGIFTLLTLLGRVLVSRLEGKDEAKKLAQFTEWLESILFALITQAERSFGAKTGQLKLDTVITRVWGMIPDKWKGFFSVEDVANMVESALAHARTLWDRLPEMIGACETESDKTSETGAETPNCNK